MIPETPDTVIRLVPTSLDPREHECPRVRPSRENLNGFGAEDRRTVFAVSPPNPVVRMTNGGTASFGLGTSRDVASCETPPDKHRSMRSSDICFPNSRLRVPVLAGSWFVQRACAPCGSEELWGPSRDQGRGCTRTPDLRFGVSRAPLFETYDRA